MADFTVAPPSLSGSKLSLMGFQKLYLVKGDSKTVRIVIDARQLSYVSPAGMRAIRPGQYRLFVGGGQPPASSGLELPFRITGTSILPR